MDAVESDGSSLHIHTLYRFGQDIDVDTHIEDAGAGSILQVEYSLPGCILRREGISGRAVVDIHRS